MSIGLRPHHFLCLPGYKGYNYNQNQKTSWDTVSKYLNEHPDTDILILSGKDDLCKKCPNDGSGTAICKDDSVNKLDEKVKNLIGIETGKTYKYSDILNKLKTTITEDIHKNLCETCAWWQKGLCRDTFKNNEKQNSEKQPFLAMTTNAKRNINVKGIRYVPKAA